MSCLQSTALDNPSFFFLHYKNDTVNNLIVVPRCFFVSEIIKKRNPLPEKARRPGWEGCNILLKHVPSFAKIPVILNGKELDHETVCKQYRKAYALQTESVESRGWLF